MSGLDLFVRLAAIVSQIPVIILTAHSDDEPRRQTLQVGAVAFLTTPKPTEVRRSLTARRRDSSSSTMRITCTSSFPTGSGPALDVELDCNRRLPARARASI